MTACPASKESLASRARLVVMESPVNREREAARVSAEKPVLPAWQDLPVSRAYQAL